MDWNLLACARRHLTYAAVGYEDHLRVSTAAGEVRVTALVINLAAVVFLVYRKRLFGVHGGRKAYDAERHHESLLRVIHLT